MRNQSEALKPNPGSNTAVAAGCICPVIDNHYGAGRGGEGARYGWFHNGNCTLHGFADETPLPDPKAGHNNPGFAFPDVRPKPKWVEAMPPIMHVEMFLVSDFTESRSRGYSPILKGHHVRIHEAFRCPYCNRPMDRPPVGMSVHHGCGVSFRADGNNLQVWRSNK